MPVRNHIQIIAHRGVWNSPSEQNTMEALCGALKKGFGIELDVRDSHGRLVVAHDVPAGGELEYNSLLDECEKLELPGKLCVNIKADGLAKLLAKSQRKLDFVYFDMSIPELIQYRKAQLPYLTRVSDVETEIIGLDEAEGLWVDGFSKDWEDFDQVANFLQAQKQVIFVSPELHGRPFESFWSQLSSFLSEIEPQMKANLGICTDRPAKAEEVFCGKA